MIDEQYQTQLLSIFNNLIRTDDERIVTTAMSLYLYLLSFADDTLTCIIANTRLLGTFFLSMTELGEIQDLLTHAELLTHEYHDEHHVSYTLLYKPEKSRT